MNRHPKLARALAAMAFVCTAQGFGVCAVAQTVTVKREEAKYYGYFDRQKAKDYKGYTVGSSSAVGEIELVLCGGEGAKQKFRVDQLKPDDGPCDGSLGGPFGYAYIIQGDVLGVGNDIVTVNMQTNTGGQTTTLPKKLFRDGGAKLAAGDSVIFIANQGLWNKSGAEVSTAFSNWKAAVNSGDNEYNFNALDIGRPRIP